MCANCLQSGQKFNDCKKAKTYKVLGVVETNLSEKMFQEVEVRVVNVMMFSLGSVIRVDIITK